MFAKGELMQWFRFYSEALDDPKVQRLTGDLFKVWVNLLCLANEQDERGTLPPLADIAFRLRADELKAQDAVRGLIKAGLLELDEERGGYVVHAWEKRQRPSDLDSTATERKRRERERNRGRTPVTRDVTVTSRVTSQLRHGPVTGDVTRLDKKRIDKSREEESRPEESVGPAPAPLRPLAQAPRPAPKRADARPTIPTVEDLIAGLQEWATLRGVAPLLEHEAEQFHDYCLKGKNGKPIVYADYFAACRNWITNPNYAHANGVPARASPNGYHQRPSREQRNVDALNRGIPS